MTKPISLEVFKPGSEEEMEYKQFLIKPLKLKQLTALMKAINDIVNQLKEEDSLKGLMSNLLEDGADAQSLANLDKEFLMQIVNSFETFFVQMPEEATKVLGVLANIKTEILEEQELETIIEVYEAVLEVNDIDKLVNRLKKSLSLTTSKIKIPGLLQKASQAQQTTSA